MSETTKLIIIGIIIGIALQGLYNSAYRWYFVRKLKQEELDVQAQYKINRIKAILETYEQEAKMKCPNCGAEIELTTRNKLKLIKSPVKTPETKANPTEKPKAKRKKAK